MNWQTNWQTWLGIGAIAGLAYLLFRKGGEGGDGGFGGAFPMKTEQPGYPFSGGFPTTKKEYASIDTGQPRFLGFGGQAVTPSGSIQTDPRTFGATLMSGFEKLIPARTDQFGGRTASQEITRLQKIAKTKKEKGFGGGGAGAR